MIIESHRIRFQVAIKDEYLDSPSPQSPNVNPKKSFQSFYSLLVFSLNEVDHRKNQSKRQQSKIFKQSTPTFENIGYDLFPIFSHIYFLVYFKENDVGLIAPFLELPSAEEYPDYYETIEQPIDMTMIKEKIDKGLVNNPYSLISPPSCFFLLVQT